MEQITQQKTVLFLGAIVCASYLLFPIWTFVTDHGDYYMTRPAVRRFLFSPPTPPANMPGVAKIDWDDAMFVRFFVIGLLTWTAWSYVSRTKPRRRDEPPDFDSWSTERAMQDPHENIESHLSAFVHEYGLCVRKELDEPEKITDIRTKLAVLQKSELWNSSDQNLQTYIMAMQVNLKQYDGASGELKEGLKKMFQQRKI